VVLAQAMMEVMEIKIISLCYLTHTHFPEYYYYYYYLLIIILLLLLLLL